MVLKFRYPDKPVETTPSVVESLSPLGWLAQAKYDGWRMPVIIHGPDNVQCFTSTAKQMEAEVGSRLAPVIAAVKEQIKALKLPDNTALDTEFIGRRGNHTPHVRILDALAWNGEWLGG